MTFDLAVAVTLGIATVVATYFLVIREVRRTRQDQKHTQQSLIVRLDDLTRDISATKGSRVSIAEEKKGSIQKMGPKAFYYLDESQVKDLYLQVFQEPEPKRIQTREIKEARVGIAAKLHVVEPKYERGKAQEVTKDYDVEQVPAMMYNKVEQFLFDKGRVIFGLDEFEFDQSEIDDFQSVCDEMKSKFNLEIADDQRATYVLDKMREFALDYIKKLASSSGYVALQDEFIVLNTADDDCILFYAHPLNEHLLPEDPQV